MSNQGYIKPDLVFRAKPSKGSHSEVCAIICDDAVWVAIPQYDILQESHSGVPVTFCNGFYLDPFGELVHHYQHVSHVTPGRLELPHHIQAPDRKWPSDRDSLECRCRHMCPIGKPLASLAFPDYILCLFQRIGPVKSVPEHLGNQSP